MRKSGKFSQPSAGLDPFEEHWPGAVGQLGKSLALARRMPCKVLKPTPKGAAEILENCAIHSEKLSPRTAPTSVGGHVVGHEALIGWHIST